MIALLFPNFRSQFFHRFSPQGLWIDGGSGAKKTRAMLAAHKQALLKFLLDGHHVEARANHMLLSGAVMIDQFG